MNACRNSCVLFFIPGSARVSHKCFCRNRRYAARVREASFVKREAILLRIQRLHSPETFHASFASRLALHASRDTLHEAFVTMRLSLRLCCLFLACFGVMAIAGEALAEQAAGRTKLL